MSDDTFPTDPIPSNLAAGLLGISDMGLFYMRRDGRGPKAYPALKGRRPVFLYSRAEVMAFHRSRMDVEARLSALEASLDKLTAALAGAVGDAA